MKISTRLSLTFSIIAITFFIVFGITVYLLSSNHEKREFKERLRQRVIITEKIFLERESYTQAEFKNISNEFLHTLPEETEEVLRIQKDSTLTFKYEYPEEIKNKFTIVDNLYFEDADVQGMSRIFQVKGESYVVIVTAVDQAGIENLIFLKKIIILLILIGVPLIFVGSFIIAKKALLPISKQINKANTIGASNLHQRLKVYNSDDELGKMTIAFNHLLDRLEASFESQKSFIRNASHEIRNPLTAIMGEAEIASSKPRSDKEYLESLNTILAEAELLNTTVTNLLQLSKVSASEGNIQYENIQFDEFLFEIKASFDFLFPENQVELTVANEKEKINYAISGNKNLLKTAIINLLDNACKFSFNNKVDVLLTCNDSQLSLIIQDKGIGIAEQDKDKIMSIFYRGNNAISIKGSGIGLSLSSKIITLHRGILDIQSQIEIGTTVHVKLPLVLS